MPDPSGQFQYPDQGWSTGKMRKAGGPQYEEMSPEQWKGFWQGNWSVVGQTEKVDPSKADPNGFILPKSHPQVQELQQQGWQTMSIPATESWSKDYQYMKPPAPKEPAVVPVA